MRKLFYLFCAGALVLSLAACAQPAAVTPEEPASAVEPVVTDAPAEVVIENPVIRLSTTTSVNDSGLLPYLQPVFEADTGYKLEVTSAGTGAAIEKARTGDADCLLVHSKSAEEEFINEGFEEVRVPFMTNYFVIVGPEDDPAGVKNAETAAKAFQAIADSGSKFITRGDASGTNNKEMAIWKSIDFDPAGNEWYINIGSGMGAALTAADEQLAYTLSDKATFLAHENSLSLLKEESADMLNTYSMIAVTTARYPDVNYEGSMAFIQWMTSQKALDLIDAFGLDQYGEQLFYSIR